MIRTLISTLVLGAALVSTAPAFAQETVSVHVSYADLNLASPQGQRALQGRIENAVTEICGVDDAGDSLSYQRAHAACVAATRASASDQERQAIAAAKSGSNLALMDASKAGK